MLVTIILSLIIPCAVFLMLWAGVALVQDKRFFGTAPKDVQAVILPKPERFKGQHLLGWILAAVSVLLILGSLAFGVIDGVRNRFTFVQFFIRFLVILYVYKIWDILFLDLFLLTRSNFFQHYYPEIKDCEGMKKYGFNVKSQIIKLIVFPFVALAIAGGCVLIGKNTVVNGQKIHMERQIS